MARDFDGTDDRLSYGSDASIDGFNTGAMSIAMWVELDATGLRALLNKSAAGTAKRWQFLISTAPANRFKFDIVPSDGVQEGQWYPASYSPATGTKYHLVLTYDGSSTANDPTFYVDGAADTTTESLTPSATMSSDAAETLTSGERQNGSHDLDGRLACIVYHNAIFTAAEANRAKWWGRPYGGLKVYHPLWTNKLTNEGTATADATATGTTVVAFAVPTVRPGSACMGMGCGW